MLPPERQSVSTQGQGGDELAETGAILRRILEGVEANVGEQFFPSLVQHLATSLGVDYAYISELSEDGSRFRSKAAWGKGSPLPPFDVPVKGRCETVLTRKCVHHSAHLRALYPQVQLIQEIEVESYCGVPVVGMQDQVLGHLAIMDSKTMPDPARATLILGIFAMRASAEFERLRYERALRKSDLTLRKIDEGTAAATGAVFFPSLVQNLAEALRTKYAFVSKFVEGTRTRVRTLAFWKSDGFLDNFDTIFLIHPVNACWPVKCVCFPRKCRICFPTIMRISPSWVLRVIWQFPCPITPVW